MNKNAQPNLTNHVCSEVSIKFKNFRWFDIEYSWVKVRNKIFGFNVTHSNIENCRLRKINVMSEFRRMHSIHILSLWSNEHDWQFGQINNYRSYSRANIFKFLSMPYSSSHEIIEEPKSIKILFKNRSFESSTQICKRNLFFSNKMKRKT